MLRKEEQSLLWGTGGSQEEGEEEPEEEGGIGQGRKKLQVEDTEDLGETQENQDLVLDFAFSGKTSYFN